MLISKYIYADLYLLGSNKKKIRLCFLRFIHDWKHSITYFVHPTFSMMQLHYKQTNLPILLSMDLTWIKLDEIVTWTLHSDRFHHDLWEQFAEPVSYWSQTGNKLLLSVTLPVIRQPRSHTMTLLWEMAQFFSYEPDVHKPETSLRPTQIRVTTCDSLRHPGCVSGGREGWVSKPPDVLLHRGYG